MHSFFLPKTAHLSFCDFFEDTNWLLQETVKLREQTKELAQACFLPSPGESPLRPGLLLWEDGTEGRNWIRIM